MMFVTIDGQVQKFRTNLPGSMKLATMRQLSRDFGVDWADVHTFIQQVDADEPLLKLMAQDKFLLWVWAWMRNAGSEITFTELEQLTADDINFGPDVDAGTAAASGGDDQSPTPAPTPSSSPKGSGRGEPDDPARPPARKAATKTTGRKKPAKKTAGR